MSKKSSKPKTNPPKEKIEPEVEPEFEIIDLPGGGTYHAETTPVRRTQRAQNNGMSATTKVLLGSTFAGLIGLSWWNGRKAKEEKKQEQKFLPLIEDDIDELLDEDIDIDLEKLKPINLLGF